MFAKQAPPYIHIYIYTKMYNIYIYKHTHTHTKLKIGALKSKPQLMLAWTSKRWTCKLWSAKAWSSTLAMSKPRIRSFENLNSETIKSNQESANGQW